jgi:hypothetical protein
MWQPQVRTILVVLMLQLVIFAWNLGIFRWLLGPIQKGGPAGKSIVDDANEMNSAR